MTYTDFESFLMMKYAESINYTEHNTNDDDIWERQFNEWLCELEPEDWLKYGDLYKSET